MKPSIYENVKEAYKKLTAPKQPKSADLGTGYAKGAADAATKHNEEVKKAASYAKGGKVKRTEKALVHKGEVVLNKNQQKKVGTERVRKAIEPTVSDYRKETMTMKGMAAEAKRRATKSIKGGK